MCVCACGLVIHNGDVDFAPVQTFQPRAIHTARHQRGGELHRGGGIDAGLVFLCG